MLLTTVLCDVPGCGNQAFMGWRPLTERRGRKICELHWRRHQDENDSFDLFEAFGFHRLHQAKKHVTAAKSVCSCGRQIALGHKFCEVCVAERKRQRNRRAYHRRKKEQQSTQSVNHENIQHCRACDSPREPGHTYCRKCSQDRQRQANRERQRRHYQKSVKCQV